MTPPTTPDLFEDDAYHPSRDIAMLLAIMQRLRTPERGCQWDLQQTFETIAPFTIEEAYEVVDAIHRKDMVDLKDELGDLLFQVVFHAAMASELEAFDFGDVVMAVTAKMIRRHPHVFTAEGRSLPPHEVKKLWASIKAAEKENKKQQLEERFLQKGRVLSGEHPSILDDIPLALPALKQAQKIQERAASKGFDWNDPQKVVEKITEECLELAEAAAASSKDAIAGEIGDILFSVVNLARHLGVDAEAALDLTNRKFKRRFSSIEQALVEQQRTLDDASLDEMEALWQAAKGAEPRP